MIHWITDLLGTAAWFQADKLPGVHRLDVRDFVDKSGNMPTVVGSKINEALQYLRRGEKVVVCCDYGISRSNAIAAGILAEYEGVVLDNAIRRVMAATGETSIKLEVLSVVRQALGSTLQGTAVSDKARRQLLMTGISGFIGSALVSHLRQRNEVIVPTHQELDLRRDIVNLDLLVREKSVNTILHLANPRVYSSNESLGATLVMLKNVLDVCAENKLHLVFLSSWEIYSGYKTKELKADEWMAPRPGGTYGQTKLLCETLINQYYQNHQVSYTILRSSPVYGVGSDRPKFIWNFMAKALCNEEIVTHKYINGFPRLDLLHIDDLCRAIVAAVERRVHGAMNIGTGVGTSTAEVAQLIVKLVGSRSRIRHLEIDGYTSNIVMDSSRASTGLEWRPHIDLEQGLSAIVQAGRVVEPQQIGDAPH